MPFSSSEPTSDPGKVSPLQEEEEGHRGPQGRVHSFPCSDQGMADDAQNAGFRRWT